MPRHRSGRGAGDARFCELESSLVRDYRLAATIRASTAAMTVTTFVFVRHGETAWNVEGRIQGHLDIPLNHLGGAQAEALGKRLVREQFDAVYSSDLVRAFHTARPTLSDPDPAIVKHHPLPERHLGSLHGLTGDDAMAAQPV